MEALSGIGAGELAVEMTAIGSGGDPLIQFGNLEYLATQLCETEVLLLGALPLHKAEQLGGFAYGQQPVQKCRVAPALLGIKFIRSKIVDKDLLIEFMADAVGQGCFNLSFAFGLGEVGQGVGQITRDLFGTSVVLPVGGLGCVAEFADQADSALDHGIGAEHGGDEAGGGELGEWGGAQLVQVRDSYRPQIVELGVPAALFADQLLQIAVDADGVHLQAGDADVVMITNQADIVHQRFLDRLWLMFWGVDQLGDGGVDAILLALLLQFSEHSLQARVLDGPFDEAIGDSGLHIRDHVLVPIDDHLTSDIVNEHAVVVHALQNRRRLAAGNPVDLLARRAQDLLYG